METRGPCSINQPEIHIERKNKSDWQGPRGALHPSGNRSPRSSRDKFGEQIL